jgi:hypothetical protein
MNSELDKLRKEMTREEFLECYAENEEKGCPSYEFGLVTFRDKKNNTCGVAPCKECYREAVEHIKFKDDLEIQEVLSNGYKEELSTIETNSKGGKQSKLNVRFDLLDPTAMLALGRVLKEGFDTYGKDNWKNIDVDSHLNHAMYHIIMHIAKDTSEEHLHHALCRMMFAVALEGTK